MHVHLIGVCGTGMGALAGLLRASGHRVTGSDTAFHPPMGPALAAWGVETRPGWDPANLDPTPDLVVVGNVCRRDNPEARAAIDAGLPYVSLPGALGRFFLEDRRSFVIAGTHGKTTTTSLFAWFLAAAGLDPGLFVGGIARDFDAAYRLGGKGAPFVLEGDEYDSAFFEKTPKCWYYRPWGVLLTSIEHDHVDIYPDEASYLRAFEGLVDRIAPDGVLVAFAGDPKVREVAKRARCRTIHYALEGDDTGDVTPSWTAAPVLAPSGGVSFDLFGAGSFLGRLASPLSGLHNLRNAVGAIALATEGAGADASSVLRALPRFLGVRRRQELLASVGDVRVYDDFAHHPTAVRETLLGLRARHPDGRLLAVYEPRSATASRSLHQRAYPDAFRAANVAWIAPVGRPEIAEEERLSPEVIAASLREAGADGRAPGSLDALVDEVIAEARAGDTIVLMSNGAFGGVPDRVAASLVAKAARTKWA